MPASHKPRGRESWLERLCLTLYSTPDGLRVPFSLMPPRHRAGAHIMTGTPSRFSCPL